MNIIIKLIIVLTNRRIDENITNQEIAKIGKTLISNELDYLDNSINSFFFKKTKTTGYKTNHHTVSKTKKLTKKYI